ncbi:MAG: hypothetical protein MUF41_00295 [Sphingopyxis sp.]|jgi:hypothetical protein|nr:hypothetical protein [Sphingopyxis sp.]
MTHNRLLAAIGAATLAIAACGNAAAQATGTDRALAVADGAALLARADRSFSELPFGATRDDARPLGLREAVRDNCDVDGMCSWLIASAPHVLHNFDENGRVESKRIVVDAIGAGEIRALGIGRERLRERVVDNVLAFLGTRDITCREVNEAGEGPGRSSCVGSIGEGSYKLIFADVDLLDEVLIFAREGDI